MVAHPTIVLGWREWVSLPGLGVDRIKAKLDTGARTSAIHANDIEPFVRDGGDWVRFVVHPIQRDGSFELACEAPALDRRAVRSSNGVVSNRWTVLTPMAIAGVQWHIELTLVGRDDMGFRLLLGRQALRHRALLDPGASFTAGRPPAQRGRRQEAAGPTSGSPLRPDG